VVVRTEHLMSAVNPRRSRSAGGRHPGPSQASPDPEKRDGPPSKLTTNRRSPWLCGSPRPSAAGSTGWRLGYAATRWTRRCVPTLSTRGR